MSVAGDPLGEWLGTLELRVLRLQDVELPQDFVLDYSADSLSRLAAVLLDRLADPDDVGQPEHEGLVLSAAAYVGESLLRVGGGEWRWVDQPGGAAGLPVAVPDPALDLPPVSPVEVIADTVRARDGGRFAALHAAWTRAADAVRARRPGWQPTKQRTALDRDRRPDRRPGSPAEREAAFAAWVARYAPDGDWDFSPDSLDALEQVVRREAPSVAELTDPARRDLLAGASWYLGEVLRRGLGGQWERDRDYEYVRQVGPYRGKMIPALVLEDALTNPGQLRRHYDRFAGR